MYSPVICLCKIPLDGVVDHRSFILEVDDSQDPVIPGWDVDRVFFSYKLSETVWYYLFVL
jgi:hypothetical protein